LEQYGKSLADYTSAVNQNPSKDAYDDFVRYYPEKKASDTVNVRNEITALFEKKLGLEKKATPPVGVGVAAATAPAAPVPVAAPVPQTQAKIAATPSPEEEVYKTVNSWLNSWESGDMKNYASSYDAATFRAQGMNLDGWLKYKNDVRNKSQNIQIEIEDLKITTDGKTAKAEFIQHYRSSVLKDKGKKTLLLRKSGNDWKIYSETWTKM
jgi:ketosteroid isomerase-like protein